MPATWPNLAKLEISSIIPSITQFFKDRKKKSRSTICDGLVLRMHYSWTLMAMLGAFVTVYYGWWTNEDEDGTKVDQIICASHFSATEMEKQRNYINVCLSYSFIEDKSRPNGRRYLLFYRWIDWSLLLLAAIYCVPRKVASDCENQKVKDLLSQIDNEEKIGSGEFKKSIARAQKKLMGAKADAKNIDEEDLHTKRIREEVKLANELIEKMGIQEDKECTKLKTTKVKELLDDIAAVNKENIKETLTGNEKSESSRAEKILNLAKAADYITRKSHVALFWKYMGVHFIALGIDLCVLGYLDFLLQGRFLTYGLHAYVWRDPQTFTDYISKTFPPFASCELNEENMLVAKRTEKLGCHLTLMELYEKVFVFLWFWLILLTFFTIVYIVGYFITFFTPCIRKHIFYVKHPDYSDQRKMDLQLKEVYYQCDYGDFFLLHQIRKLLSNIQMFELLLLLRDPESLTLLDTQMETPEPEAPKWTGGPGVLPVGNIGLEELPKYMMDANSNKPKQMV
ncbi:unnamed protein product [Meganyctiphanes norvegica]|uniref:Innexin n=1 Tax=Meganyctiphanes norvegica TaxID=48144 RepID=A0AAV2R5C2_MEGNR